MKIGDEVYVHGFIDEIRNDVIIIRNDGGYFGTAPSEVVDQEPKCEDCKWNTWDNNCMVEYRGCRFEPKMDGERSEE